MDSQLGIDNNEKEVYLYVSNAGNRNPAQGNWTMNVVNSSGGSMIYHGWLFDSSMGATLTGGDSQYSINSPGSSTAAITVGSYVTRFRWQDSRDSSWNYTGTDVSDNISPFSSIGPRSDGLQKPEIAAPGQGLISVRSSSSALNPSISFSGNRYMINQGTSMSTPVVAGSAALLLQQSSTLNVAQIKKLITGSPTADSFTGQVPNATWGYGKINVFTAMSNLINPGLPSGYNIFTYDQWGTSSYTNMNPNEQIAVRFSPAASGQVTGALFHPFVASYITSPLFFEVWSDTNGLPGSKLGNTVSIDASKISLFSWNFADLQKTNVKLSGGKDYHLVSYFTSGSPTGIFLDTGSPDSRSSINNGNGWELKSNYDFRLRPIAVLNGSVVSVRSEETLPQSYQLYNNYPNPFNPSTVIGYQLPKSTSVQLKVYDILGREVSILVNEFQLAGTYKIIFNANNAGGYALPSGVYFYRLQAGTFSQTKKFVLLK
jgi:minor extracellular serine protease Vpr